ncbi:radical SAM protein [Donghicola sp. C2-DW-16]|uniref:Radical SAM protein n=1 Tax=Donghicola mangrovi TaxID=2729614 RepID=A0ABX2PB84_9RHOB|nr:radical SAM protein [Donghicola mangrovi]NVO26730.1 radical SAM protein [Donghicola mangrovi]
MSHKVFLDTSNFVPRLLEKGISIDDVVLYINSQCNLRCKHCYIGDDLLRQNIFLDVKSVFNIISETAPLSRLTILGGEPMLHKNIEEILLKAANADIRKVRVTTNLTKYDWLSKFPKSERIELAVSLDGHNHFLHEFIRGNDTFNATVQNIKNALSKGIDVEVSHTINALNIHEFEDMLDFLSSIGVRKLNLHKISNFGNAHQNTDLLVSDRQWVDFFESVIQRKNEYYITLRIPKLYILKQDYSRFVSETEYKEHVYGSYYGDGHRVVIYPNKKVYISSESFESEAHIGTFNDSGFVWNDGKENEYDSVRNGSSMKDINKQNIPESKDVEALSYSFKVTLLV